MVTAGESNYSWFSREEYELQRSLDLKDWAITLKLRVTLKEQYQPSGLDERGRKQFWDQYCKYVSLIEYLNIKRSAKILDLGWRPPPLVEVTREMLIPQHRERIVGWMIAMSGCRMLQINPWSNYELLKKRFDQWLRGVAKEFQPPFKRRGHPAANIGVTKLHLDSWVNHSILAVFDIDFHSEVFAKRRLLRSALHEIINPGSQDAAQWAKDARRLLQEAINGLEFLIVQAESGAE